MTRDEDRRQRERRAQSNEDRARVITDLVRSGRLTAERVTLASAFFDEAASLTPYSMSKMDLGQYSEFTRGVRLLEDPFELLDRVPEGRFEILLACDFAVYALPNFWWSSYRLAVDVVGLLEAARDVGHGRRNAEDLARMLKDGNVEILMLNLNADYPLERLRMAFFSIADAVSLAAHGRSQYVFGFDQRISMIARNCVDSFVPEKTGAVMNWMWKHTAQALLTPDDKPWPEVPIPEGPPT